MSRLAPRLEKFAAAFAAAAGFPKNPPLPVTAPTPDFIEAGAMQIMRSTRTPQKEPNGQIIHFPTSNEREFALSIIRWCMAVPKIQADSPRFAYYVSRWDVPGKVARAIAAGTFDEITANCPPIDPAWVRFVPAALEAHRQFIATHTRPKAEQPKLSGNTARSA